MILARGFTLQALLAGAGAANQPEVHVDSVDHTQEGVQSPNATQRAALSSTTDVDILAAPVSNPLREVVEVMIYNKDTASVTVTVKTDNGTTERIIVKRTLTTLQTLFYTREGGWQVIATA